MKKKTAFYVSLGMVAVFFIVGRLVPQLCGRYNYSCQDKFEILFPILLIFFPTLLFSVVTYKMREEVFRAWLRFAYGWIPLSVVLIYLAGGSSGGGFGIPNVLDRESVAFIFASLFALISLVLIVVKSILLRGK